MKVKAPALATVRLPLAKRVRPDRQRPFTVRSSLGHSSAPDSTAPKLPSENVKSQLNVPGPARTNEKLIDPVRWWSLAVAAMLEPMSGETNGFEAVNEAVPEVPGPPPPGLSLPAPPLPDPSVSDLAGGAGACTAKVCCAFGAAS